MDTTPANQSALEIAYSPVITHKGCTLFVQGIAQVVMLSRNLIGTSYSPASLLAFPRHSQLAKPSHRCEEGATGPSPASWIKIFRPGTPRLTIAQGAPSLLYLPATRLRQPLGNHPDLDLPAISLRHPLGEGMSTSGARQVVVEGRILQGLQVLRAGLPVLVPTQQGS